MSFEHQPSRSHLTLYSPPISLLSTSGIGKVASMRNPQGAGAPRRFKHMTGFAILGYVIFSSFVQLSPLLQ